jgi:hypothetical protein
LIVAAGGAQSLQTSDDVSELSGFSQVDDSLFESAPEQHALCGFVSPSRLRAVCQPLLFGASA